jgi:hypothetical protein
MIDIRQSAIGNRHFFFALIAAAILVWLVLPGLRWGLPSEERNLLTLGADRGAWRAPAMSEREKDSPWEYYPNNLSGGPKRTGASPRSAFNPLRSYHPDEYVFLKSLSAMKPSELKLFPGFFGWPALQFYVSGVALKVSSWFGAVTLVRDMDFYFQHPGQAARLYEVGRIVTLLFAAGCILVIWRAAGRLFGPAGGNAAALLLAVTPLFTINARYWTADVPMLFWISLALLFSTHILAGGGRRWYVLGGIALGLAASTRYQGAAAAFLIAAAHWVRPDSGTERCERGRRFFVSKDLWLAAAISLAVFLACNPCIISRPGQFVQEFSGELRGSQASLAQFSLIGPLSVATGLGTFFFFGFFAAFLLAIVRRDRAVSFVLLGFGPPAVFLLFGLPAMARYWMPVLPLPVLLVAWAFATVHRRGLERRKPGAKVAPPILLLIVLFATGLQSFAFGRLYTDPKYDTRTRAGEWIAENIPAYWSIGVLSEPWQFELPPINPKKYRLVKMDLDVPRWQVVEFFVTSDLQAQTAGQPQGLRDLFFGKGMTVGRLGGGLDYLPVQTFQAWPAGFRFSLQCGPQDMHYTNPEITVARPAIFPSWKSER